MQSLNLSVQQWRREFLPYFLDERRATHEARNAVLDLLEFDAAERDRLLARGKKEVERAGTDATGTLGEAHLSFVLERQRQVYLTKACWKEHPLEVTKGIDLVGVRLEDGLVTFAEVKTWPSIKSPSALKGALAAVVTDLDLSRCDDRFHSSSDSAAYLHIAVVLKQRLRAGSLPDSVREKLAVHGKPFPRQDCYHRLGTVIADTSHPPNDVEQWPNHRDHHPWELLLLNVEGLAQRINELAGAEEEWKRQELKREDVR